jgi:gluconokinase
VVDEEGVRLKLFTYHLSLFTYSGSGTCTLKPSLILALDIGTSSVRAAVYDDKGKPVRGMSAKAERSFAQTPDGGFEIDAEQAFKQVVAVIDAVLAKAEKMKGEIEDVAACAFWHSLVGVDEKGKPTTPVFGWADTRSRKYSDVLRKRFDEAEVHNRTGARFHSSYWPAKLLWLQKERPENFGRTAKWLSFSDYVLSRLIDRDAMPIEQACWQDGGIHFTGFKPAYEWEKGLAFTSVSMASGTGLFNVRTCEWDDELVSFLKLGPDNLPQIIWRDDHSFCFSAKYRRRWKRLEDAEIFPAIGDGAADNIGAGCVSKDRAALMVGTSGAMRVAYKGEPPKKMPDGLFCYRIDRKRVVLGGALSDGGNLYRWLTTNLDIPKKAEGEMRRRGAAAHGLTVLPFFHGERSTGYNENATGAITGLAATHDSIDILQASMEAIAYRFAEILDQLNSITKIKEIVASGGALRDSPVWTQIIADVLGRDLTINNATESSMRGAVLLALESLGKIGSIESLPAPTDALLEHHPKCHAVYKLGRKQHQKLYLTTHK